MLNKRPLPTICWRKLLRLALLVILPLKVWAAEPNATSNAEWPVYRHDVALSGVTLAKGKITSPEVLWEYYLGIPPASLVETGSPELAQVIDLDGDGVLERYTIDGNTITTHDINGKLLWSHTVSGFPLGGNLRVAKLLPDRKGLQILSFSHRMDTGEGQGYLFAFDKGVQHGELNWTTGPLTGQHGPTLIVDDVDGDGLPEVIVAPHYRVQIYNGQTGELKAEVPWDVGRNYGILLTKLRRDSLYKDIFIICDFVPHVDCIGYREGEWKHVWGHKYVEPNAPTPRGREKYIRLGPQPLIRTDGDGRDWLAYMYTDVATDNAWHLHVHATDTGELIADLGGIWVWSIRDLDGDGRSEIIYTPTKNRRPDTYCDLRVAHLEGNQLADIALIEHVRPLTTDAVLPQNVHTIADEGQRDLVYWKLEQDGRPALFVAIKNVHEKFPDTIRAVRLEGAQGENELRVCWEFSRPGHHLNLLRVGSDDGDAPVVRIRDLTTGETLSLDAHAAIIRAEAAGRVPGFSTTPIVVDLDRDGRNEIVLQNAAAEIVALRMPEQLNDLPDLLWKCPGVAMSPSGGYTFNGPLCPQAGDLDGDGYPEVLFATESSHGTTELNCVDGRNGQAKWRCDVESAPWGGLQAGIDTWTIGNFLHRPQGRDVLMGLHLRSKNSGEGWLLRGDAGEVVWKQVGLVAGKESAMPFGSELPAVTDIDEDGGDDLIVAQSVIYGAINGKTGTPLYPPTFMPGPHGFGKWIAYASPTAADLDNDGVRDVYLNSRSYARGGYAACRREGQPMWVEFHDNLEGSDGFGPVGDFDGDGHMEIGVPILNGTLACLNAADGTLKWKVKMPVVGDVVAGDVNGDGTMELVFCGLDGWLHAVSGKDGHEAWSIAASGRPVIADLDGDGSTEVLVVGSDGVLRVIGQRELAANPK